MKPNCRAVILSFAEKLPPANSCAVKMFAANAPGTNAGGKDVCTHRTGLGEMSLVSLKAITSVLQGGEGGYLQRARGSVTREAGMRAVGLQDKGC